MPSADPQYIIEVQAFEELMTRSGVFDPPFEHAFANSWIIWQVSFIVVEQMGVRYPWYFLIQGIKEVIYCVLIKFCLTWSQILADSWHNVLFVPIQGS